MLQLIALRVTEHRIILQQHRAPPHWGLSLRTSLPGRSIARLLHAGLCQEHYLPITSLMDEEAYRGCNHDYSC